nr:S-adenosylmethionine:tRNA ribosyltransferase-isomerase [Candidatus Coxiella mudrowiae]
MLLTNFHFSKSTFLMLVCAFGSYELIWKLTKRQLRKNIDFLVMV